MTQEEAIALWTRCEEARKTTFEAALEEGRDRGDAYDLAHEAAKDVWNGWAAELLQRQEIMKRSGEWAVARDARGAMQPQNQGTRAWFNEASVDFSRLQFRKAASAQPPANPVLAVGSRARFSGFVFPGAALFREAMFGVTVWFEGAIFHGRASFNEASFAVEAWFERAEFSDVASFDEVEFASDGWFENVTFSGNASFLQANFKGYTTFSGATFAEGANFTAISGERAFQLGGARFLAGPPSFVQADFKKAPRLDDVHVPLPHYFAHGNKESAARYRVLRQFADAGLDHERERTFFKGEVRSRRLVEDRPIGPAFWLGLAYDALSDFGTSIMRPMALWFVSAAGAVYFYLAMANAPSGGAAACTAQGGAPIIQALFLSVKNALVVLANYKDHRVTQAYHCLFSGPAEAPEIPFVVTIAELSHTLWSAVLIFLLLLAVRNQFRIR
jgi:hypothetical protein